MTHYPLRQKAADGVLIGTFVGYDSPAAVEAISGAGFGFLCIDAEHSPFTLSTIADLVRSSDLGSSPAIVRVPETGPIVSQVLDAGAAGVLVPRIETPAQAADVVSRARYVPEGTRGLGPGRGGFSGGSVPDHTARVNAEILVAIQIETQAGLDAADEILAVPGIDTVIVGPADLSASLQVPIDSPEHVAAVDTIFQAALRHGVAPGSFCFSAADAESCVDRGARVLIVGADGMFLMTAATQMWSTLEALTTRPAHQPETVGAAS